MINKIAAGEVVERPSSIVKELAENSIDAGARAITVEIKDGGISYIRVTDNGRGIAKEDVERAFLRHATSKISIVDDLETLITLGFRGEALSSIAAISQTEMITKTEHDITGTLIQVHGGKVVEHSEIGCVEGTSVIVRNIFYNVPARRKFLKKPAAESAYVSDIVTKLALGHPEIAFRCINNNATVMFTDGKNDLKSVILSVYGKDTAKKLLEVEHSDGNYSLSGFVGKPEIARGNRIHSNFFINGRYIKNQLINTAVLECFTNRIMTGKSPFFILNLTVSPSNVDINVHPTKIEARFSNDEAVFNFVVEAVRKAFKDEVIIPQINFSGTDSAEDNKKTFSEVTKTSPYKVDENLKKPLPKLDNLVYNNIYRGKYDGLDKMEISENKDKVSARDIKEENKGENKAENKEYYADSEIIKNIETIQAENEKNENMRKKVQHFFDGCAIIGQAFGTYWFVENNGSIYIVDQHAAHERILYEELAAKFKSGKVIAQNLLTPQAVKLTELEYQAAIDNRKLLESFGFELEEFGENTFALRSVPYIFDNPAQMSFFLEIIGKLAEADNSLNNIYDIKINEIASISCKAAVKAHRRMNETEAAELISKALKLENPFNCPHGRPTIVEITKNELEKMFRRT